MGGRFALARLGSRLCGLGGSSHFGFCRSGQVKIASAAFAELDVLVAHEDSNLSDGQAHVASAARLVADHGNSLFLARPQAIVMAEDGRRDLGAQLHDLSVNLIAANIAKFQDLKFPQIPHDTIHSIMERVLAHPEVFGELKE